MKQSAEISHCQPAEISLYQMVENKSIAKITTTTFTVSNA
jgi:hypothetical protein